ncbi:MAG: DUF368 domain-containing protein [Defluviitaleaceae bacterium]|nr:DUF368 domain-containing protein [Defluviitaleaceae bacterium]
MDSIINFFKGVLVGIVNIMPGFSSGTMLILCGIYEPLLDNVTGLIKSKKQFVKGIIFLLPIALGVLVGIFAFAQILSFLLERFSLPTYALFAGLVLGSIPMIVLMVYTIRNAQRTTHNKKIENERVEDEILETTVGDALLGVPQINDDIQKETSPLKLNKFELWHLIPIVLACVLVIGFAVLQRFTPTPDGNGEDLSFIVGLIIVISGIVSGIAVIVPGLSGALMLILMGQYTTILSAISLSEFEISNIPIILLFILGVAIGLIVAVFGVRFLLKRFRIISYLAIIGFLVGSVASIFILTETYYSATNTLGIAVAVILFIVGAVASFMLSNLNILKKSKNRS